MKIFFYFMFFLLTSAHVSANICLDLFKTNVKMDQDGLREKWIYAGDTRNGKVNLWGTFTCSSCASKTFALPSKDYNKQHCQSCGKPHQKESFQAPKTKHEGSKVYLLDGTGHMGRDELTTERLVACPYCKSSTFESTNFCGGCGAEIKGQKVSQLVEDGVSGTMKEMKPKELAQNFISEFQVAANSQKSNESALKKGLLALASVGGVVSVVATVQGYHWYTEPIPVSARVVSSSADQVTLKFEHGHQVIGDQYMDLSADSRKANDAVWRINEKVTVYFTRKDGAGSLVRGNGDIITPVLVVRP